MKGNHCATNHQLFCWCFKIRLCVWPPHSPKGAKYNVDEPKAVVKGSLWSRASEVICLATLKTNNWGTSRPSSLPQLWPAARWILATTSCPWSDHLPGSTPTERLEGHPWCGPGPSYLLSQPRARGTTPGRRRLPSITEEPEAEHRENVHNSSSNPHQRPPPHYGSCCPNNLFHHWQQAPGAQGQDSEGGEGKIKKSPTETPTSLTVAKENNATKEENPLVMDVPSAAWAE